MIFIIWQQYEQ